LLRMRGLSILVTAPLVIAALYILLFPRFVYKLCCACVEASAHAISAPLRRWLCRDALSSLNTLPEYTGEEVYAVVFDAGSTGSRVHVLKFQKGRTGLQLLEDTFDSLKPGLGDSGWKDEPERAAASLQPLLEKAIAAVPEGQQGRTPVELRATAGLRLLGDTKAKLILEAVTKVLESSPFMLVPDGVSVMDGIDEGAYAWLTLNYLLGKTGKPAKDLVGAIDLGGGSVQQAFAVDDSTAVGAPEGMKVFI
jgi:apyrase